MRWKNIVCWNDCLVLVGCSFAYAQKPTTDDKAAPHRIKLRRSVEHQKVGRWRTGGNYGCAYRGTQGRFETDSRSGTEVAGL